MARDIMYSYTTILLMASSISHLVDSKSLVNAALFKPSYQSSTFVDGIAYDTANYGNDGRRTQDPAHLNCTHTNYENPGWWLVDLQGWYLIDNIVFTNRFDYVAPRLENFKIDVFRSDPRLMPGFPLVSGDVCYQQVNPLGTGTYYWHCTTPVLGKFLRIIRYTPNFLHFCELEAMSTSMDPMEAVYTGYDDTVLSLSPIVTITTETPAFCALSCLGVRDTRICLAFNWFQSTGLCQLLDFNPSNTSLVVNLVGQVGARLYVVQPIKTFG